MDGTNPMTAESAELRARGRLLMLCGRMNDGYEPEYEEKFDAVIELIEAWREVAVEDARRNKKDLRSARPPKGGWKL